MVGTFQRVRWVMLGFLLVAAAGIGDAVSNWSAPAMWSPPKAAGGKTTLDLSNPLPFIPIAPCRLADTRGGGFTGAYGPPALASGAARSFPLTGQCGISTSAKAVSLNITVVNPAGSGFILIYPQGGAQPVVSTLNYSAGQTVANAAVVPLGTGGGVTVVAGVSGTDLIIDTNGYYYDSATGTGGLAPGEYFGVIGDRPGGGGTASVLFVHNTEPASGNSLGAFFQTDSTGGGSAGLFSENTSTSGVTFGVWARDRSTSNGPAAVFGEQLGATGANFGVKGATSSTSSNAVGVYGTLGPGFSNVTLTAAAVRDVERQRLTAVGSQGGDRLRPARRGVHLPARACEPERGRPADARGAPGYQHGLGGTAIRAA